MRDRSTCLHPDFASGCLIVSTPVCVVVVLVQIDVLIRKFLSELASNYLRSIGSVRGTRLDYLYSVSEQNLLAFRAGVTRQTQGDVITALSCNHAVRNASVTAACV